MFLNVQNTLHILFQYYLFNSKYNISTSKIYLPLQQR